MTNSPDINRIAEQLASVMAEQFSESTERLEEELSQVRMVLDAEDRGWGKLLGIAGGDHLEGLDLDEAKKIARKIRPHLVGDSLPKRAVDLHAGYVWSRGLNIEGVKTTGKRGRRTKLVEFYENPINQEHLFSSLAHEELQKARFADGNVIIACNKSESTARVIPFEQITRLRVNPDHPSEVWMYRREWTPEQDSTKPRVEWYYTNRYAGTKSKTVTVGNKTEKINRDVTVIDRKFNRLPGYVLGCGDGIAGMPFASAYVEIMQYGRIVDKSLANLLFKVTNKTRQGVQASAVKIANSTGAGNTASMVEGQDIQALSTAGKGYNFSNPRPVAALAAAAWNVSNMDLLNDSAAAGSSYGSANALMPANKNAMRLMQAEWISMYQEILRFFDLGTPRVWFENLDEEDKYRSTQSLVLGKDALHPEEYRSKVLDLQDIPGDPSDLPDSLTIPPEESPDNAAAQAAAPDQGRSSGTGAGGTGGGGQGANDLRSDVLSQMASADFLDRFESLVERFESAQK